TGGEPLLRPDLVEIVERSARVSAGASLALTTNGIGLEKRIEALLAAGLTRLNISLDTVDRDHFARLTRRDRLPAVMRGIDAARRVGISPLKINAVLMRDTLDGAADLVGWTLEHGVELRFIEQMPLDADEAWVRNNMVEAAELVAALAPRFTLSHPHRDDPHAPAETWLVDGGPHSIGIIASVTRSFCEACDRTRLTAEGTVRSCLFGDDETDLRGMLRSGASDRELADRWRAAMWTKQSGHGMSLEGFRRPARTMGAIGG
ncbi:MAG: radical SAM protein, partial [Microbacteriaceae bacterium]|nr:radical SAM protein [Microbacteriaceae bacterium]